MNRYEVKVEMPGDIRQFFDYLTGMCEVSYTPGSPDLNLTFEAEDDWELSQHVNEVRNEIRASGFLDFSIDRPTPTGENNG